jgi:hypothetical protein
VPSERERGGLVGVKKTLVDATPAIDPAIERTILSSEIAGDPSRSVPDTLSSSESQRSPRTPYQTAVEEPTKPATFHLPISLLQRLRATCRLKNTTMVEFVRRAVEDALERQRPTEEEIRQLLGH